MTLMELTAENTRYFPHRNYAFPKAYYWMDLQLQPEVLSINNPANFCYCPDALSGTDTGEVKTHS